MVSSIAKVDFIVMGGVYCMVHYLSIMNCSIFMIDTLTFEIFITKNVDETGRI
jgi:hypothetical protein